MKLRILFLLFSLFTVGYIRLAGQTMPKLYELTEVDITTKENVTGKNISVFGVHLGMTADETEEALIKYPNLSWTVSTLERISEFRMYVYYTSSGPLGDGIMNLIWMNGSEKLNRIIIHDGIKNLLHGKTKDLFSRDPLNPNSDLAQKLFGPEDCSAVTLDVPADGNKITEHHFEKVHLTFMEDMYHSKIKYKFILEGE